MKGTKWSGCDVGGRRSRNLHHLASAGVVRIIQPGLMVAIEGENTQAPIGIHRALEVERRSMYSWDKGLERLGADVRYW